jgi:two-component system sensor histidine kinase PilS (NtrC family)
MTDPTLRRKLLWLIIARVVVVTLLLGSAILVYLSFPALLPVNAFFFVIALTYCLTAVYALLLKQTGEHPWIAELQLIFDAVIVSALVYMTGGILSYFATLYTLPIIAASTIRSRRGGVLVGVLSSAIYMALVLAQYLSSSSAGLPAMAEALPPLRIALFSVGLNVFGFLAVALLSGYLAEGLRRADAQLRSASNQLSDLQAFSQHVIDSLASGLATTDVEGRIITWNSAAEATTGVAAPEAVGQSIAHVLQWEEGLSALSGAGTGRRPLPRVELELARADGKSIEIGLSTAILRTPRGETGFVFTFRDVTEARREERAARVQQRLAAVGQMAAGIAHEIRNPLASMSGSIQILRQELPLTGEQSQLMDIVIRESDRLNDTIRSFLDYARPQRKPAVRVDVREILTETAALLQNSAERLPTHSVTVHVPPDPACCLADEAQIRQVVWNLASNALRAMPDGGVLRMSVAAHESPDEERHLTIAVRDEGVGIAPADLEDILQPFRGGFARGTGLGLSIVHRIVSDYGGDLQVASKLNQGTTVTVKLPLASCQLSAVSSAPPALSNHPVASSQLRAES